MATAASTSGGNEPRDLGKSMSIALALNRILGDIDSADFFDFLADAVVARLERDPEFRARFKKALAMRAPAKKTAKKAAKKKAAPRRTRGTGTSDGGRDNGSTTRTRGTRGRGPGGAGSGDGSSGRGRVPHI